MFYCCLFCFLWVKSIGKKMLGYVSDILMNRACFKLLKRTQSIRTKVSLPILDHLFMLQVCVSFSN